MIDRMEGQTRGICVQNVLSKCTADSPPILLEMELRNVGKRTSVGVKSGKHFFGTRIRKDLVVEKVQYLQKKFHCQWTLLRGKKPKWIFHNVVNLPCPFELVPALREREVPMERQVQTVLGGSISKANVISIQAPHYRQYALFSDFLEHANWAYERKQHCPRSGSRTDLKG